jgi:Cytochrome b subunit of the bc complex
MNPDAGHHQRNRIAAGQTGGGATKASGADRLLWFLLIALWVVLLGTALTGMSDPLGKALGSQRGGYVAAVAFELFAAILFLFAYIRRVQHGESAYLIRVVAWGMAIAVATLNWSSHKDEEAVIFALASLGAAFLAAVLEETKLRQTLRDLGYLGPRLPVYPLRMQLFERPLLARAKALAARDPGLGLYGSIDAARAELAEEQRKAEEKRHRENLSNLLYKRFRRELGDDLLAQIATASHDMDATSAAIREEMNTAALAKAVAAELTPEALTGSDRPPPPATATGPQSASCTPSRCRTWPRLCRPSPVSLPVSPTGLTRMVLDGPVSRTGLRRRLNLR